VRVSSRAGLLTVLRAGAFVQTATGPKIPALVVAGEVDNVLAKVPRRGVDKLGPDPQVQPLTAVEMQLALQVHLDEVRPVGDHRDTFRHAAHRPRISERLLLQGNHAIPQSHSVRHPCETHRNRGVQFMANNAQPRPNHLHVPAQRDGHLELEPIRYRLRTRMVDRFHGWLDGVQRQPNVAGSDIRTAYWKRLDDLATALCEKEKSDLLKNVEPQLRKCNEDRVRLDQTVRQLANAQCALDEAERAHRAFAERVAPEPDPKVEETIDQKMARKRPMRLLNDAVRAARAEVATLSETRDELEISIRGLEVELNSRAAIAEARSRIAYQYVIDRQDVYRQSLVRSHPHGNTLDERLSAIYPPQQTFRAD
jgi:hypothetical protein